MLGWGHLGLSLPTLSELDALSIWLHRWAAQAPCCLLGGSSRGVTLLCLSGRAEAAATLRVRQRSCLGSSSYVQWRDAAPGTPHGRSQGSRDSDLTLSPSQPSAGAPRAHAYREAGQQGDLSVLSLQVSVQAGSKHKRPGSQLRSSAGAGPDTDTHAHMCVSTHTPNQAGRASPTLPQSLSCRPSPHLEHGNQGRPHSGALGSCVEGTRKAPHTAVERAKYGAVIPYVTSHLRCQKSEDLQQN